MSTHVGMAVDASDVTLVVAHTTGDGISVETVRTFPADTLEHALAAADALTRRGDPVRVAVLTPDTASATLDITEDLLSRDPFTAAALRATSSTSDGVAVAGHINDVDAARAGRLSTALVTTAPASTISRVYATLRERHPVLEVTASALATGPLTGTALAIYGSTSELTLSVDGRPIASRVLRAGGLNPLTALLGGDSDRMTAGLTGRSPDPIAAAETSRWVTTLAGQVAATLTEWSRQGLPATPDIFIHGPGAASLDLPGALADVGLGTRTDDVLRHLPGAPSQRPAAVLAYLAAATLGDCMPYAAYVDPFTVAELARKAARRARTRTLATLAASAVMILTATAGPATYAHWASASADQAARRAAAHLTATTGTSDIKDLISLTETSTTIKNPAGEATAFITALLATAPDQAQVNDVTVNTPTGHSMRTVDAQVQVTSFTQLTAWMTRTRTALAASYPGAQVTTREIRRTPDTPTSGAPAAGADSGGVESLSVHITLTPGTSTTPAGPGGPGTRSSGGADTAKSPVPTSSHQRKS